MESLLSNRGAMMALAALNRSTAQSPQEARLETAHEACETPVLSDETSQLIAVADCAHEIEDMVRWQLGVAYPPPDDIRAMVFDGKPREAYGERMEMDPVVQEAAERIVMRLIAEGEALRRTRVRILELQRSPLEAFFPEKIRKIITEQFAEAYRDLHAGLEGQGENDADTVGECLSGLHVQAVVVAAASACLAVEGLPSDLSRLPSAARDALVAALSEMASGSLDEVAPGLRFDIALSGARQRIIQDALGEAPALEDWSALYHEVENWAHAVLFRRYFTLAAVR